MVPADRRRLLLHLFGAEVVIRSQIASQVPAVARSQVGVGEGASGPSVSIASTIYEDHTDASVPVTLRGFTPGETWALTISSTGGGTNVTDTGTVPANGVVSTTQDLSGLGVGTLSVSATEAGSEVATRTATMAVSRVSLNVYLGQSNQMGFDTYDGLGDYQSGTLDLNVTPAWVAASSPLRNANGGTMGSSITFSDEVYANEPDVREVALTLQADGGTGFSNDKWNPGDQLYNDSVAAINAGYALDTSYELDMINFSGGEKDDLYTQEQWTEAFIAFADAIRTDLTAASATTPIVLTEISSNESAEVLAAIQDMPNHVAYCAVTSVAGMTLLGDGIHWDAASTRIRGTRDYATLQQAKLNVPTVPDKVGTVTTVARAGEVRLSWGLVARKGSAIIEFDIQYKESTSSTWLDFSNTGNTARTVDVTGLSDSTQYDFQVRAVNALGDGEWSDVVSETPLAGASAFEDDFNRADSISLGANWTAKDGSDPGFQIVSNRVQTGSGGANRFVYCPEQAVDAFSEGNIYGIGVNQGSVLMLRGGATRSDHVSVRVTTSGNLQIDKTVGGSRTTLYNAAVVFADGDHMRLEAEGDTARVYLRESATAEATVSLGGDLATADLIGLGGNRSHANSNVDMVDNFRGGPLAA